MGVKAADIYIVGDKQVWLDVAKTHAELRPNRVIHRMGDMLGEAEAARQDKLPVDKKLGGKYINVGDDKVGYTLKGNWVWSEWAISRYSESFRDAAKAYAEDD